MSHACLSEIIMLLCLSETVTSLDLSHCAQLQDFDLLAIAESARHIARSSERALPNSSNARAAWTTHFGF